MTIEETREALSCEVDSDNPPYKEIMRLADAYGAARELRGHVDACGKSHDACHVCCAYDAPCPCDEGGQCAHPEGKADIVFPQDCGDGWLCETAEPIKKSIGK